MGRFLRFAAGAALIAGLASATSSSAAAPDLKQGAKVFRSQCGNCHSDKATARPGPGPNLFGVVGRRAGTLKGYTYSSAMKNIGLTWTPDELKLYIANPKKVVPGDKMAYGGLRNSTKLDLLVAYLATLK